MALPYPPFKTKVVEPIAVTSRSERQEVLVKAAYNMFRIPSDKVGIDLLTDSGTGAMSAAQWGRLIEGDEAYAGATSFRRFRDTVRNITGMEFVLPVHQGRAGERIVFEALVKKGMPFRTAYKATGALVRTCQEAGVPLAKVTLEMAQAVDPALDADVLRAADPFNAVAAKKSLGGTAPEAVRAQLGALRDAAAKTEKDAAGIPRLASLFQSLATQAL